MVLVCAGVVVPLLLDKTEEKRNEFFTFARPEFSLISVLALFFTWLYGKPSATEEKMVSVLSFLSPALQIVE